MRYKYLYLFVILFGILSTACQSDIDDGILVDDGLNSDNTGVISMVTGTAGGTVSLSVDAPAGARFGVWIDLDGNGLQAEDGTEDVNLFNVYQKYALATGVKKIAIHGDITYLAAASNELTEIDITGNPHLTTLNLPQNKLSTIDLSANPGLRMIDLSGNNIASMDLSVNKDLESLWVFNNQLMSLDLTAGTQLTFLDCSGNQLSELDLSNNSRLVRLLCYNNKLTSIDLSANEQLNLFWAFGNLFSEDETEKINSSLGEELNGDFWITEETLE